MSNLDLQNFSANIESRVGRVEGGLANLTEDVRSLAGSVSKLSDSLNDFKEAILGKFTQVAKPQWSIIISFTTMLIAIFTLGGGILMVMMNGQRDTIVRHDAAIDSIRECQVKYIEHIADINARVKSVECNENK